MRASLESRLRGQLAEFPYRRLFVGFSGGLDSTVLLQLSRAVDAAVTALHVHHGLHPDAGRWERHCAEVSRELGVGFLGRRADPQGDGEAAARAVRFAIFEDELDDGDLLLLGHHQDDQAETVLLRLVQGRAPLGMPRTRRLRCGARVLRPWLETPREALLRHARQAGLDWIEDPTNLEVDFDRNFLRREIVPKLAHRWPGVSKTLAASAATQLARDALLEHLAGGGLATAGATGAGGLSTASAGNRHREIALKQFPAGLRVAMLRLWLRSLGEYSIRDRALAEFVRQFDAPADAHPRLSLQHGVLRRHGTDAVYGEPEFELLASYRLDLPGVLKLPHGKLLAERHAAGFHAKGPLDVRFRRGGERLRCGGRMRLLKKLLQARGVPAWRRRAWPLIYGGDALLAVPGIATADTPDREPRWRVAWQPGSTP